MRQQLLLLSRVTTLESFIRILFFVSEHDAATIDRFTGGGHVPVLSLSFGVGKSDSAEEIDMTE